MNTLELTPKQKLFFEFVKEQHGDQIRKYTGKPYWTHLLSVASIVARFDPLAIEVALGHDLIEDVDGCEWATIFDALVLCGYTEIEAYKIASAIQELTDKYTKENYPSLNRKARKRLEANRLSKVSSLAQTAKYADLIDNTAAIVEHDINFSRVYLDEKFQILEGMRNGNVNLLLECMTSLAKSINIMKEAVSLAKI